MAKAKVWNMHPLGYTHKEMFREEMIEIKANEFIVMDDEDAVLFKGQYFPMKFDAQDQQDPKSYKVIKVEPMKEAAVVADAEKYVSMIDGKEFTSQAELDAHLKQFADQNFVDEEAEAELPKAKRTKAPKETRVA